MLRRGLRSALAGTAPAEEAPPREAPSGDQKGLGWCFGACLKPPMSPLASSSASAALLACRHRGFETVTYVLPERAGLVHRDSIGTKMSYGDGAVQWMTAGRGTPHEETNPSLNPHPNPPPNPNPHPNPPHDPNPPPKPSPNPPLT